jgi:hypothetical protein
MSEEINSMSKEISTLKNKVAIIDSIPADFFKKVTIQLFEDSKSKVENLKK